MDTLLQIDLDSLPATFVPRTPLSDRALDALCRSNDLIQFERTREGEIRMNAPTGGFTSSSNAEITSQLHDLWLTHQQGMIFDSNGGFRLPDGSMLSPDAAFVSPRRLKGKSLKGFPRVCPDFVIELLSETDRLKDLQAKMVRWVENGALLAWLIDPYRRRVTTYRPGAKALSVSKARIDGEGPVAGFTLDLARVWSRYKQKR